MKKARAENVTLKRELHGLLKVQGSIMSTMFKKSVRRKEEIITILSWHMELSSDVFVTISNQKIGKGAFGVVSIGDKKLWKPVTA